MELSDDLLARFNDQITLEFTASMVYRQLAVELAARDLPGMATWLRHQADEEVAHAYRFIGHVLDRGGRPRIGTLEMSAPVDPDVRGCFEAAFAHEQRVSEAIRDLYRAAEAAGDLDARPLLSWFVDEQIEEEAGVRAILGRLRLIGDDGPALAQLDSELGRRGDESQG